MQAGNYIHQLQMHIRHQHELIGQIDEGYRDLLRYLVSSKFDNDTTVQVKDVINRLQPIRSALMDAAWVPNESIQKLIKPVVATGEITSL